MGVFRFIFKSHKGPLSIFLNTLQRKLLRILVRLSDHRPIGCETHSFRVPARGGRVAVAERRLQLDGDSGRLKDDGMLDHDMLDDGTSDHGIGFG